MPSSLVIPVQSGISQRDANIKKCLFSVGSGGGGVAYSIYIYIYIYTLHHACVYIYAHIYIYTQPCCAPTLRSRLGRCLDAKHVAHTRCRGSAPPFRRSALGHTTASGLGSQEKAALESTLRFRRQPQPGAGGRAQTDESSQQDSFTQLKQWLRTQQAKHAVVYAQPRVSGTRWPLAHLPQRDPTNPVALQP